jgi:hypothetical protein
LLFAAAIISEIHAKISFGVCRDDVQRLTWTDYVELGGTDEPYVHPISCMDS